MCLVYDITITLKNPNRDNLHSVIIRAVCLSFFSKCLTSSFNNLLGDYFIVTQEDTGDSWNKRHQSHLQTFAAD